MDALEKQAFVRQQSLENRDDPEGTKVFWSRHAVTEAVKDGLARQEVEAALQFCKVIEDYPAGHRALPDCLVLGYLANNQPLHAVVAIDETNERVFMITVYLPSEEKWHNDWQTRK